MTGIKNKNILVVDDSMTNLVLLEAILNLHGYSVRTAYSHNFARRIMQKWQPDLILVDLLMPDEERGYDFFCQLIKDEKLKNAKVAIVSAINNKTTIRKILKEGAAGYITKPIDTEQFPENVMRLFE